MIDLKHIFTADDWGLSPAVNEGILHLARPGWLKSVACLATAPFLDFHIEELRRHCSTGVTITLHFNLTYGRPLTGGRSTLADPRSENFYSHHQLIWRTLTGQVRAEDIAVELVAQLAALESRGLNVAAINGHHHIQLLPVVGRTILAILDQRPGCKLQLLLDPDHILSFMQSQIFLHTTFGARDPASMEAIGYLRPQHLRDRDALIAKISSSRPRPLLTHPATACDFKEHAVVDRLEAERVWELNKVKQYLECN